MNLASFLVAMVGPMVARVLSALGLSLVVLTGATAALTALRSTLVQNIGGLPAVALQLGGLLGIWQALGILLGAMTFVMTWKSTAGFWALAVKS